MHFCCIKDKKTRIACMHVLTHRMSLLFKSKVASIPILFFTNGLFRKCLSVPLCRNEGLSIFFPHCLAASSVLASDRRKWRYFCVLLAHKNGALRLSSVCCTDLYLQSLKKPSSLVLLLSPCREVSLYVHYTPIFVVFFFFNGIIHGSKHSVWQ